MNRCNCFLSGAVLVMFGTQPLVAQTTASEPVAAGIPLASDSSTTLDYLEIAVSNLLDDLESNDDIRSSHALITLTYRVVETRNVVTESPLSADPLYDLVVERVKAFSLCHRKVKQTASVQCIVYLILQSVGSRQSSPGIPTPNKTFESLLKAFSPSYNQSGSDILRLAMLGAINETLTADVDRFRSNQLDIGKIVEMRDKAEAELDNKSAENAQLERFIEQELKIAQDKVSKSTLYQTQMTTEKIFKELDIPGETFDQWKTAFKRKGTNQASFEKYLLVLEKEQLAAAFSTTLHAKSQDTRISALVRNIYATKFDEFKLKDSFDGIVNKLTETEAKFEKRTVERKSRSMAALEFVSTSVQPTSRIVDQIAAGVRSTAEFSLITYSGSSAFVDAEKVLSATAGTNLKKDDFGSRISAIDIRSASSKSAADNQSSSSKSVAGNRSGVSNTATFDPKVAPIIELKMRNPYPASDYRGTRIPSLAPLPENSTPPVKAQGAKPAKGATPAADPE